MTFTYHRAVAPMMWVLVGLASVELVVVHVMAALLWNRTAALLLSLVTLAGLAWLVGAIAAMKRRPVVLGEDRLTMRVGKLKHVEVPLSQIAGLRERWDGAAMKDRRVLNLALIAYPNVVIDLTEPLPGRRGVMSIAHRLDDPNGFAVAIERRAPR